MSVADGGLHVDSYGSGPAVVLLHGAPSSPDDFAPLADRLARHRKVLIPHLPGYGRSAAIPGPYSLKRVIADVEHRLVADGVALAAFVAFSGGAYKAVSIALRGRITVSRMVLFAPMIGLDADAAQNYRDVAAAVRTGAFDARPSWLERMAGPGFATRDPAGAARVLAWLDAVPLSVVCDELVAAADAPDLRPRLSELAFPILVCAGDGDNAVPVARSEEIARRARRGTFECFTATGHAVLIERPQQAIQTVDEFLDNPLLEGP
jgi:pimeloyl-ACP methyl ester carboxylesterase